MIDKQHPDYKQGFQAGYALGARPIRSTYWLIKSREYCQGYNDGYRNASEESDDAFQSQYSMDNDRTPR